MFVLMNSNIMNHIVVLYDWF